MAHVKVITKWIIWKQIIHTGFKKIEVIAGTDMLKTYLVRHWVEFFIKIIFFRLQKICC